VTVLLEPSNLATRPGAKQAKAAQALPTFEDDFEGVFDDPEARMVFFRDLLEFLREFCAGLADADDTRVAGVSPRRVHRAAVRPGSSLAALAPPRKAGSNKPRPPIAPAPRVDVAGPAAPALVVPAAAAMPVAVPAAAAAARPAAARTVAPQVAMPVPAGGPLAVPVGPAPVARAGGANPLLRVPPFVAKL